MDIQVSEKEHCVLSIHYECNKDEIEKKRDEVLEQFRKAPVKGFRPGSKVKPDMTAIRLQYAKQIDESLQRALAEKAYIDTITEKEIKPFGMPEFSSVLVERDKFSCDFSLRKKPDFVLGQYKDLEIPKPHNPLTMEVVAQEMLQEWRIRHGEGVPYVDGDFVETTDNVIVDYDVFDVSGQSTITGHDGLDLTLPPPKVEALCGQAQLLTIGRSKLPEFDRSVLGMKVGETRDFTIKVPDFGLPSVAGKDLKFVVSLISGSKIKPNPLNDTLAVKMQKKDLPELMTYVNELAAAKVQEQSRQSQILALSGKLVDDHEINIPEWLSISEAQYLTTSAQIDWKTLPKIDQDQYIRLADKNVKLAMILDKVRENEPETQLADQEVVEMIRGMISKMGDKVEIDKYMAELNKSGQLVVLTARIRDEYALDFLVKNTKWIE
jgi:FKBP-type peptidyl-prolyl cis-trans isomerase (trigger factor)